MIKKYAIILIIGSFINYLGCYSYEQLRSSAIKEELEQNNHRELSIVTKDYIEYHFDSYMYSVKNDSLLGVSTFFQLNREVPFNGKIALNDITDIKIKNTNTIGSIGMVLGLLTIFGLTIIVVALASYEH
jgi:hypothetical protein